MPPRKKKVAGPDLSLVIAEAMADKKSLDPVILDLTGLNGTVCDAFVICHGSSRTQVEAIARNVRDHVKKVTGLNPTHTEGLENAEWILIDYFDVVAHIFQDDRRRFYNIEQLWADAKITRYGAA